MGILYFDHYRGLFWVIFGHSLYIRAPVCISILSRKTLSLPRHLHRLAEGDLLYFDTYLYQNTTILCPKGHKTVQYVYTYTYCHIHIPLGVCVCMYFVSMERQNTTILCQK